MADNQKITSTFLNNLQNQPLAARNMILSDLTKLYDSENTKAVRPNFKKQMEQVGAMTQMITLATGLPTIEFKDKQASEYFKEWAHSTFLLEKLQRLELELYKNGTLAVGFYGGELVICEAIEYETDKNGDLTYLLAKLKTEKTGQKVVTELLEFSNGSDFVNHLEVTRDTKTEEVEGKSKDLITQEINNYYVPFVIFKNKADGRPDVENVNPEFFHAVNTKLTQLQLDVFHSTPLPVVATGSGTGQAEKAIKALYSLEDGRIYNYAFNMLDASTSPLQFISIQTQAPQLINSINELTHIIKKSMFTKVDSSESGTRNIHTAEIQAINSDFEDMIEAKANLREMYFFKLFTIWAFYFYDFKNCVKSVTVNGSTSWLEQAAQRAQVNQNGINLNHNTPVIQTPNQEEKQEEDANA